jgi:hypothetical protein
MIGPRVRETPEDIRELQALLDRSRERAGPHLRSIYRPENAIAASQLVSLFRGKKQVALATVTAAGEPRVAPVDALLLRGRVYFGTHISASRIRHLRRHPAISLAYFERDELAVVVHGTAVLIEWGDPEFATVDDDFRSVYGGTPSTEEEGSIFVRVEPELMFTFARRPQGARPEPP